MKIDGKAIAKSLLESLTQEVTQLKAECVVPHLAVILIGDDASSAVYVRQKELKTTQINAKISVHRFGKQFTEDELLSLISRLNADPTVHGIIIQRPLPPHIDGERITYSTAPEKDIDGFRRDSLFDPPVALAVRRILDEVKNKESMSIAFESWIKQKNIVILGKGQTAGKPIITYFTKMKIPLSVIDSKTEQRETLIRNADIIISAVGKKGVILPNSLKKGVILIGVGMHQEDDKMHADYEEELIVEKARYYTPVPGGVGPVNVAMLLQNLVKAAKQQ